MLSKMINFFILVLFLSIIGYLFYKFFIYKNFYFIEKRNITIQTDNISNISVDSFSGKKIIWYLRENLKNYIKEWKNKFLSFDDSIVSQLDKTIGLTEIQKIEDSKVYKLLKNNFKEEEKKVLKVNKRNLWVCLFEEYKLLHDVQEAFFLFFPFFFNKILEVQNRNDYNKFFYWFLWDIGYSKVSLTQENKEDIKLILQEYVKQKKDDNISFYYKLAEDIIKYINKKKIYFVFYNIDSKNYIRKLFISYFTGKDFAFFEKKYFCFFGNYTDFSKKCMRDRLIAYQFEVWKGFAQKFNLSIPAILISKNLFLFYKNKITYSGLNSKDVQFLKKKILDMFILMFFYWVDTNSFFTNNEVFIWSILFLK